MGANAAGRQHAGGAWHGMGAGELGSRMGADEWGGGISRGECFAGRHSSARRRLPGRFADFWCARFGQGIFRRLRGEASSCQRWGLSAVFAA